MNEAQLGEYLKQPGRIDIKGLVGRIFRGYQAEKPEEPKESKVVKNLRREIQETNLLFKPYRDKLFKKIQDPSISPETRRELNTLMHAHINTQLAEKNRRKNRVK